MLDRSLITEFFYLNKNTFLKSFYYNSGKEQNYALVHHLRFFIHFFP